MEIATIFRNQIIQGNVLTELRQLPNDSIDTIITSPPYWGLRNYGEQTKAIFDGTPDCAHEWALNRDHTGTCMKCNAWFGQLGLEPTLEMFIDHFIQITLELHRVLKPTGVLFWNHGDAYASNGIKQFENNKYGGKSGTYCGRARTREYPAKSMLLQNYRLITDMIDRQDWVLRNVIIWHKPNHMPSSMKDRFANAYDSVFMVVKNTETQFYFNEKTMESATFKPEVLKRNLDWKWSRCPRCEGRGKLAGRKRSIVCARCSGNGRIKRSHWHGFDYWFDLDAVRIPHSLSTIKRTKYPLAPYGDGGKGIGCRMAGSMKLNLDQKYVDLNPAGKNPGDVWLIPTHAFPGKHFATYPEKLIEPMIKAGCPLQICNKCGKPRVRVSVAKYIHAGQKNPLSKMLSKEARRSGSFSGPAAMKFGRAFGQHYTKGWTDCLCNAGWHKGIVLDPFMGSGTTAVVALKLGRDYLGIEINPEYVKMANDRIKNLPLNQEPVIKSVKKAA